MPFQKGQSGNPSGKRNMKKITTALACALTEGNGQRIRNIAENVVKMAEDGDKWAIQFLTDRIDGKPEANLNVTGNHTVTHESAGVSETADWLAGVLGAGAGKPPKDTLPN